jgi:hypothetical protein
MGMSVTQYVKPEYLGYAVRITAGYIVLCRSLETARKINTTGIVRLCVADHCSFGPSPRATVSFTENDQSWPALSDAMAAVEMDDEVYPTTGGDEPVDYDGNH